MNYEDPSPPRGMILNIPKELAGGSNPPLVACHSKIVVAHMSLGVLIPYMLVKVPMQLMPVDTPAENIDSCCWMYSMK